MASTNSKALVILAIGKPYVAMWGQHYRPSVEKYAAKNGYDVIVIEDYIDQSPRAQERTPHWQKCLILEHPDVQGYEDVVWLDADININFHHAPCIISSNPEPDKIGLVSHNTTFSSPELWEYRWDRSHKYGTGAFARDRAPTVAERYAEAGLPTDMPDMVNTGVMVLKRSRHGELLRWVYDNCEENERSAMEQMPLSYHIFKNDMFASLDPRFNKTWSEEMVHNYGFLMNGPNRKNQILIAYCVTTAWLNNYFLHFLADGMSRGDVALIQSQVDDPAKLYFGAPAPGQNQGQ